MKGAPVTDGLKASTSVTGAPFTMGAWAKTPTDTLSHPIVQLGDDATAENRFSLNFQGNDAGDPLRISALDGTTASADTTTGYSPDTWHHALAVVASTTSRTVYIDGGSAATDTTSITPTGVDHLSIGYSADSTPFYGDTTIAEVALWNVALSAEDAAMLAAGVSPLLVRPDALVSYFPLHDSSSTSMDVVGRYEATWTGTPAVADHPRVIYPSAQILQFPKPRDIVTDKYIVGGTVFGDNDTTNVKMVGPDGQILMTGPATYTAQAVGGNPKINGITSYTSINGVSTFTSINGVT